MKLAYKVFNGIVITLTIVALLFLGGLKIPQMFGVEPMVVQSGSMEPNIHTGSIVFCNTNDTDIEINDVVTLQLEGDVRVTHRVMDIKDGQVLTKGDANDDSDGYRDLSMVYGTVIFSIPKLGYVVNALQGKMLIVIICWLAGLNIVSLALSCFVKKETE